MPRYPNVPSRYAWIPPAKSRRIPSTRPVTILDTPPAGGGYEYRASYCGIPLQVFSQRPVNGDLLKAGDTIIARWVPGAEQLWFPSPERNPEILYFTPGFNNATNRGELWRYDGTNPPTLVWEAPDDEIITCLSYHAGYLFIFTYWGDPWASGRMYRMTVPGEVVSLVGVDGHAAEFTAPDSLGWDPDWIKDTAEYSDGLLYLIQYSYHGDFIYRYNATTDTLTRVFTLAVGVGLEGGIAVVGNPPTKLIACDGWKTWESPTGDIGSWVYAHDFWALFSVEVVSLMTGPDGAVYTCCMDSPGGPGDPAVLRYDGVNWTIDRTVPFAEDPGWDGCVGLGMLFDATDHPNSVMCIDWGWWFDAEAAPYRRVAANNWVQDWIGPPPPPPPPPTLYNENMIATALQMCATVRGIMCGLWRSMWPDPGTLKTRMWARPKVGGVWQYVREWDDYSSPTNWTRGANMSPAPTIRKPHEL